MAGLRAGMFLREYFLLAFARIGLALAGFFRAGLIAAGAHAELFLSKRLAARLRLALFLAAQVHPGLFPTRLLAASPYFPNHPPSIERRKRKVMEMHSAPLSIAPQWHGWLSLLPPWLQSAPPASGLTMAAPEIFFFQQMLLRAQQQPAAPNRAGQGFRQGRGLFLRCALAHCALQARMAALRACGIASRHSRFP